MLRRLAVSISAVLAVIGAAVGSGAFGGTPIAEAQGGALAADATVLAPAGPAFAIWSVVYLGLLAYAVWQWLPSQRDAERHRRVGGLVAASMLLNAVWILGVQFAPLWLSVVVIAALAVVLARILALLVRYPPTGRADALITDGTFGIYLGWVSVATIANVTAWLTASGFDGWGLPADAWGIAVLGVGAAIGIGMGLVTARVAPALAMAWAFAWIAVGRTAGEPESWPVATVAVATAVLIVAAPIGAALRRRRSAA